MSKYRVKIKPIDLPQIDQDVERNPVFLGIYAFLITFIFMMICVGWLPN